MSKGIEQLNFVELPSIDDQPVYTGDSDFANFGIGDDGSIEAGVGFGALEQDGGIGGRVRQTRLEGELITNFGRIGGDVNYWSIAEGDLAAIGTGNVAIRAGQTAYNTGTGFWLGRTNGTVQFSLGNPATDSLTWDGTTLSVSGAFAAGSIDIGGADATSFHVDATGNMWLGAATFAASPGRISNAGVALLQSGTIGGWTLSASTLSSGSVTIDATNQLIRMGAATSPTVGIGVFLGLDGADYEFRAGNPAGIRMHWDGAALTVNGPVLTNLATGTEIGIQGWTYSGVFSTTDADTVSWGAGTFTLMNGVTYAIGAGSTGNMVAKTYIFLDIAVSTIAFQTTTTRASAFGTGRILVAVAQNETLEASFIKFGDDEFNIDGLQIMARSITATEIVADTITANEIAANTITGTEILTMNISGKTATFDTGTVGGWTMGATTLTNISGGNTVTLSTGANAFIAGPTGAPTVTITTAGVLNATGVVISGAITATSGAIGGWTINATSITDTTGVVGMSSAVTVGDDIRFWAGDATPGSAEFRVYESGALVASSATITGAITATSGAIGGFDIGADYIRDAANSMGLASTVTGGDDVRFWAGDTFVNRATAPFRVTEAGAVTATSATITGTVTMNAGTIAGTVTFVATAASTIETGGNRAVASLNASNRVSGYLTTAELAAIPGAAASRVVIGSTGIFIYNAASVNTISLNTDGSATFAGGQMTIDTSGNVTVNTISATAGTIAAFTIAASTISATNLTLTSGASNTANITVGTGATAGGLNSAAVGGDIIFWGGDTFANRATAPFRVTAAGAITATSATITGALTTGVGSSINGTYLTSASVASAAVNLAMRDWNTTIAFSVTDADTVAWAAGDIVLSDGTTYAIVLGNTGNMVARTYIYLDIAVSVTVLQTTTTASTAVGNGKKLIATAINGTDEATFEVFGGIGGMNINGSSIVALSITGAEIAGNTVTAGKLSVATLSAITADMGTITAGSITAGTATIGGFSIGADFIRDAANSMGLASTVTGGDDVRFWAGDTFANRATAPFRVTEAGAITATSATITGSITSTAGSIAAFTIAATTLSATNLTLTSGAANTANIAVGTGTNLAGMNSGNAATDIAFWAGDTFANRATAPFRATLNGQIFSTNFIRISRRAEFNGSAGDTLSTQVAGSGSVTRGPGETTITTGGTISSRSRLYHGTAGTRLFTDLDWDNDTWMNIQAKFSATTNQDAFMGIGFESIISGASDLPVNGTSTLRHIGFYIEEATIWASNADGTTQTRTDVSAGITLTNLNTFSFVYDADTNIRFYINGTLVATHTTNRPTGTTDWAVFFGIENDPAAEIKIMRLSNGYTIEMVEV